MLVWLLECEKQGCPEQSGETLKVCGKVVGERQEHLSQLYECCVVWKAMVIVDDNSLSLIHI